MSNNAHLMPVVILLAFAFVLADRLGLVLTLTQQIGLGITFGTGYFLIAAVMESRADRKIFRLPPQRVFDPETTFTTDELAWYDGVKNTTQKRMALNIPNDQHPKPEFDGLIFVGVKGNVYSVAREWYGDDSPYHAFAGVDASRHLGKVVVGRDEANCDWSTLAKEHLQSLDEWEAKFKDKYPVVGKVKFGPDFTSKAAQFEP